MEPTTLRTKNKTPVPKIALPVLGVLVLCGLSFWGGSAYGKGQTKTSAPGLSQSGQFSTMGGPRGIRQGGGIGNVTAISDTSITVKNDRTSESKTYTINSSTTITNDGASATASDIKTGDTVLVEASSSDSTTATRITLNPSFGGGMGPGTQSSSDTNIQTN